MSGSESISVRSLTKFRRASPAWSSRPPPFRPTWRDSGKDIRSCSLLLVRMQRLVRTATSRRSAPMLQVQERAPPCCCVESPAGTSPPVLDDCAKSQRTSDASFSVQPEDSADVDHLLVPSDMVAPIFSFFFFCVF